MADFQDKRVQIQELNRIKSKIKIFFFHKGVSSLSSPSLFHLELLTPILIKNMLVCATIIKGVYTVALYLDLQRLGRLKVLKIPFNPNRHPHLNQLLSWLIEHIKKKNKKKSSDTEYHRI